MEVLQEERARKMVEGCALLHQTTCCKLLLFQEHILSKVGLGKGTSIEACVAEQKCNQGTDIEAKQI